MLGLAFAIGLTGALAPGPTLLATVNSSLQEGWKAGPKVAAGHAQNALPQRAVANVNCRIIPGETVETTLAALEGAIANPAVKVVPLTRCICHQRAVFCASIPSSAPSTWAAASEGASPTTVPEPCSASQARRSAFMAVVLSTCRV